MILSKKYIESMNKITVDDELKNRILKKVSDAKYEDKKNDNIILLNKNNKIWTKPAGFVAACCAFVVCTSLNSKFPELFNRGNGNNNNVEHNNSEVNDSVDSEEISKSQDDLSDEIIRSDYENNKTKEDNIIDNWESSVKENNNYINNHGKDKSDIVKTNEGRQENNTRNDDSSLKSENKAEVVEHVQEEISSGNNGIQALENDNINENNDVAILGYSENSNNQETNNFISSDIQTREMPGEMKEKFEIPNAIETNGEVIYTLLVSEDVMEVGYKNESNHEGVLKISSHKLESTDSKKYDKTEVLSTCNGNALLMSNNNNNTKHAEWKYNNKFYSLDSNSDSDNEEIIEIIESCK